MIRCKLLRPEDLINDLDNALTDFTHFSNIQHVFILNPIRPGLFSRSPGPGGGGAQRPGCQKSKLTSPDLN